MATFRYIGVDDRGQDVSGQVEATSAEDARRILKQRGVLAREVVPAEAAVGPVPPDAMSLSDAEEFAQTVAQLSGSSLSLATGLRAAAEEAHSRRVSAALRWLAQRLEEGQSLETALHTAGRLVPRPVRGLILAARATGHLGEALVELVDLHRSTQTLRRAVVGALSYPVIVAGFATLILAVIAGYIGALFQQMFDDFGLNLPFATKTLFWMRSEGFWYLLAILGALAVAAVLYRWWAGRARWHRELSSFPLFGPVWHWLALAEWSGLLGVLLKYSVPLPEALRLAADGVRNAYVSQVSLALADGTAKGRTLSQLMSTSRGVPRSLVPLIRWGEQTGTLPDALGTGRDMFQVRVRQRSLLFRSLLPPALFVAIGCCVVFVVFALFVPLVSLISALS